MISIKSVLALDNSFVTIDRLLPNQSLRGIESNSPLLKVIEDQSEGVLVETKYYSILVSPQQNFIVSPTELMEAQYLMRGDKVLTAYGFQPLTLVAHINRNLEMASILAESPIFIAEGFYLPTN